MIDARSKRARVHAGLARAICIGRPNESWTKYYEGNFLYEFELTDGGSVPVVGGQNDIESSGAGCGAAGPWDVVAWCSWLSPR